MSWEDMKGKKAKLLGGVAAALILGAVGSGIWERLLKPALDGSVDLVVWFFGALSSSFKDYIYTEAAQGFHEKHSLTLLVFGFGLIAGIITGGLVGTIFLGRQLGRSAEKEDVSDDRRKILLTTQSRYIGAFIVLTVLSALFFMSAREAYINRVATWSLVSMERLRATISPEEYLRLRSSFFGVNSAKEYYEFHSDVTATARKENIRLRAFEPL